MHAPKPARYLLALTLLGVLLAGCSMSPQQMIAAANKQMREQVASDVSIAIDQGSEHAYSHGGNSYFVCGAGIVNQPGLTDHEHERFIIRVRRSNGFGFALFDGDRSPEGVKEFQQRWDQQCI